jgi:hypothetical protein
MGNSTVGAKTKPGPKQEEISMKFRTALFAAFLFVAGPALAQTSPTATSPARPVPHQPGVPAQPAHVPAAQPAKVQAPAPPAVDEKIDPAKEAAIRHLMDITETAKLGDNITAFITNQVRSVMSRTIQPENLDKFMDTFSQKFGASAPSSAVTDAMVPIYARAFSMEDIQGLVQFYESPLGRRVVKALPDVMQDSQNAGAEIDRKAAIGILRGMSAEYPELSRILPPEDGQSEPAAGASAAPEKAPAPSPTPSPAPEK